MCGRYSLASPPQAFASFFHASTAPAWPPRYNIAPTQEAPVLRLEPESGERRIDLMRWGLVPFWAKDPSIGNRLINARAEGAAEKPAFRAAFRSRRCIVPADGFYEWMKLEGGKSKRPFWIARHNGKPLALAGLWERWNDESGAALETFTILTTTANEAVAEIHDRMPAVLLDEHAFRRWLDPQISSPEALADLLAPAPAGYLTIVPVSARVNNPRNDDPACLKPVSLPDVHDGAKVSSPTLFD